MRASILSLASALCLTVGPAACTSLRSSSGWLPPPLPVGAAGLSAAEVARAGQLYIAKCAKCHGFYHPANYTAPDWTEWMSKMSRKSKLQADEEQLLSRYLGAFRTEETAREEQE